MQIRTCVSCFDDHCRGAFWVAPSQAPACQHGLLLCLRCCEEQHAVQGGIQHITKAHGVHNLRVAAVPRLGVSSAETSSREP